MPFLTSKSLPRRTVLRGIGATLSLPFLEAMVPVLSRARAAGKPVNRFLAFRRTERHGDAGTGRRKGRAPASSSRRFSSRWRHSGTKLLVLSGLNSSWNYIHAGASGSFLTGTTRGGRNEVEVIADVSIDQLLARKFANETQVASLELSMDGPANAGACTGILSCAYTAHDLMAQSDAAFADGVQPASGVRETLR